MSVVVYAFTWVPEKTFPVTRFLQNTVLTTIFELHGKRRP